MTHPPCPTVARHETPVFLVIGWDGPNSAALRQRDLDGHLQHVEANWQAYLVAGPLREPGGEALVGSLFLVQADNEMALKSLMERDPYFTSGQYGRVDVQRFTASIGAWMGGKIWESADAIRHRAAGGPIE
jgi:uncharacterized protein